MEYAFFLITLILLVGCWVPRDPCKTMFIGALIGAGASLIGGALNRKAQKKANAANAPVSQVAQWEAAGINPAFGISSGAYIPQQAATIGDSFAQAGAIFGEGLEQDHTEKLKETETKKENKRLREELDKLSKPQTPTHLASYGAKIPLADPSNPAHRNAVSIDPGNFKFDGEAERLDLDKGGTTKEESIHQINLPFFGNWETSRPMVGERMEGYAGDILTAPLVLPAIADDALHNARGDYFDASQQTWRKQPRNIELEPKGSGFATVHPNTDGQSGYWDVWEKEDAQSKQYIKRNWHRFKDALTIGN